MKIHEVKVVGKGTFNQAQGWGKSMSKEGWILPDSNEIQELAKRNLLPKDIQWYWLKDKRISVGSTFKQCFHNYAGKGIESAHINVRLTVIVYR